MRISDWSSDVCSSDLLQTFEMDLGRALSSGSALIGLLPSARTRANLSGATGTEVIGDFVASIAFISQEMGTATSGHHNLADLRRAPRSEEGRVGKEGVSTGRTRWCAEH